MKRLSSAICWFFFLLAVLVYLLYQYKSTNTDARRRLEQAKDSTKITNTDAFPAQKYNTTTIILLYYCYICVLIRRTLEQPRVTIKKLKTGRGSVGWGRERAEDIGRRIAGCVRSGEAGFYYYFNYYYFSYYFLEAIFFLRLLFSLLPLKAESVRKKGGRWLEAG